VVYEILLVFTLMMRGAQFIAGTDIHYFGTTSDNFIQRRDPDDRAKVLFDDVLLTGISEHRYIWIGLNGWVLEWIS
jgi:hypothetical protein